MTRRSELEKIRQPILNEIYRMSIELGIDPDTLDINLFAIPTPVTGDGVVTNNPLLETPNTFNALCYKLQVIQKLIGETL